MLHIDSQNNKISLSQILLRPKFPLVITGYTITSHLGDYYKRSVRRLVKSLIQFDLPYIVYPMQGVNDWCKGCSFKPILIQHTLQRYNQPVLWIDADGEVFRYPSIFENAKFDIAIHNISGHWVSGTLYMSPKTLPFVDKWCDTTPTNIPDEISLLRLWNSKKHELKLKNLPISYNKVVHSETDVSELFIGHYIRPDIAPVRKVKAIKI